MIFIASIFVLLLLIALFNVGTGVSLGSDQLPSAGDGQDADPGCRMDDPINDPSDPLFFFNPATGLPMVDDLFDVGGNPFGTSNSDDNLLSGVFTDWDD